MTDEPQKTKQQAEDGDLIAALQQARATVEATRFAVRELYEAIEAGEYRGDIPEKSYDLYRLYDAVVSNRPGCITCSGSGQLSGCQTDAHIPAFPASCPDCDPGAPGFAREGAP